MILDLVCHVVDNYGDIAVVWRLAQALVQDGAPGVSVRLLLDSGEAFQALCPFFDLEADIQTMAVDGGEVTVLQTTVLTRLLDRLPRPDVVVEAFGAPTPVAWLNAFYASAASGRGGVVLHLEYLTAEAWSEEYHLLPSPLGHPGVQRFFFVPGFRPRTGGLVFTDPSPTPASRGPEDWLITLFSYEHDFSSFWADLVEFLQERHQTARVIVFAGRSRSGALGSWTSFQAIRGPSPSVTVVDQPFVDQNSYTAWLAAGDFHVVRGEESWVQAVLAGRPFLWHAYLQPEGHQRVKVAAFLEVWRPWFEPEGRRGAEVFEEVSRQYQAFNERLVNSEDEAPRERYRVFWENSALLRRVGEAWAAELRKNAKLSRRMLEFLEKVRV